MGRGLGGRLVPGGAGDLGEERRVAARTQVQELGEDAALEGRLVGGAQGVTEGVGEGQGARRAYLGGDLRQGGEGGGGDAPALDLGLDQTDRLMAEGSDRYQ